MIEENYNFEVIKAPAGATVPYLPDVAEEQSDDGKLISPMTALITSRSLMMGKRSTWW